MLDSLLKVVGEYGNPVPRYTGQRCLVERMSVGGCDLCQQICPHDAISISHGVQISDADCTGCGLCTQACPSGALEFDVTSMLEAVHSQPNSAKLVCSKSGEAGKTIPCLARVTASIIVAAGGWDKPLELVHGDCAGCELGGPRVPEELQAVVDEAQQLREATGRAADVTIRPGQAGTGRAEGVSRRGMFGSLLRSARTVASEIVPDRPLPFVDWSVPQERVPSEWVWRRRAMKPTPAPGVPVRWPAPVADETCIFCPVCANVCPTEAIQRDLQPDGAVTLRLDLSACTGCGACARSCPPQAITLQEHWQHEDFAELLIMRDSEGARQP